MSNALYKKYFELIANDSQNKDYSKKGYQPLFSCSKTAKIVIIGQAPGMKAQEKNKVWDDKSGEKLINWLGITFDQLRNDRIISLLPMDFYYPGKGKTGDLPPRKGFAEKWHVKILDEMKQVELIILIGKYAQGFYLVENKNKNLTETVINYKTFLPKFFPIVHPSPLNFRWLGKNKWFEEKVIPDLKKRVKKILK